jgi:hypothetical protein
MHDAVGKDSVDIVQLLLSRKQLDCKLKNNKGLNVIHLAAVHTNNM